MTSLAEKFLENWAKKYEEFKKIIAVVEQEGCYKVEVVNESFKTGWVIARLILPQPREKKGTD